MYYTTHADIFIGDPSPDPVEPEQPEKPSDNPSFRDYDWKLIGFSMVVFHVNGVDMIRYAWVWQAL